MEDGPCPPSVPKTRVKAINKFEKVRLVEEAEAPGKESKRRAGFSRFGEGGPSGRLFLVAKQANEWDLAHDALQRRTGGGVEFPGHSPGEECGAAGDYGMLHCFGH